MEFLNLVVSESRLEREKGLKHLESEIGNMTEDQFEKCCNFCSENLKLDKPWEAKFGCLCLTKLLLEKSPLKIQESFKKQVEQSCMEFLSSDDEYRVRDVSGKQFIYDFYIVQNCHFSNLSIISRCDWPVKPAME